MRKFCGRFFENLSTQAISRKGQGVMVEPDGIEPTT